MDKPLASSLAIKSEMVERTESLDKSLSVVVTQQKLKEDVNG